MSYSGKETSSLERLAVPEQVGPTDEELTCAAEEAGFCYESNGHIFNSRYEGYDIKPEVLSFARAVLARWGTPNLAQVRSSLGDEPVPAPGEMQALATAEKERAPIPKPQPHGGRMIKGWQ